VFYIAKFLNQLQITIEGSDVTKSVRTIELEKLNIKIAYQNPTRLTKAYDLILYSDSLPDNVLSFIKKQNKNLTFMEIGIFKNTLIQMFEDKRLTPLETNAFVSSNLAPLYSLNLDEMRLIGVTGTDGKTTVISMIYHILSKLDQRVGMITTVGAKIDNQAIDTGFHVTTPSSQDIYKLLTLMKSKGCKFVLIECTSQGLFMGRLAGLKFDVGVFTNIKKEHLGYHKTWKNYAQAKSLLITKHLKPKGTTVMNADDLKGYNYIKNIASKKLIYATNNKIATHYLATDIRESNKGNLFKVGHNTYNLSILGRFNVSNALASACALIPFNISIHKSLVSLSDFLPVLGRMNILQEAPFTIIVDFAHTPNGLKNVLRTAVKLKSIDSKLILVFGCAAKRDEYKRPIMGKWAKKYADITILTAEDCRFENLRDINDQIAKGWKAFKLSKARHLYRFDDPSKNILVRKQAIEKALKLAKKGDVILITGKGHENSLCFGEIEYPWNDIEETMKLVKYA